ncbi:MAG TPA: hypothetical protein VJB57_16350 [Dehalococcoidia bacterium]|nr:hypothetical protein [Dehalococcoidia bacterium]
MKLRKQTPLKAALVAVTAALLAGFYSIVRSEPQVKAAPAPPPPPVDYGRFFAPNQPVSPQPATQSLPHTRTRGS